MDDVISIVRTRDNEQEFDLEISGSGKKATVRFVIEDKDVNYSFVCNNPEGDKWVANIPPMPQLTKKAYPFRIEVIIDGYYFEPYRKTINVIAEPTVKSSDVETGRPEEPTVNIKVKKDKTKPVKKTAKKKPGKSSGVVKKRAEPAPKEVVKEVETVAPPEDSFADMASSWLNREKPVVTEQDKKVKNLINSALKTKPSKKVEPTVKVEEKEEEKVNKNDIKIKAILGESK